MKFPTLPPLRHLAGGILALCLATAATAQNIMDVLDERPEFETLFAAVNAAGLADALASADNATVFAPSDDAFAKIPEEDLAALLANPDALSRILLYHVAPEKIRYRDLESGPLDTLLQKNPDDPADGFEAVDIDVKSYFWGWFRIVHVDEARITRANIHADNGVIHRIDHVLDPGFEPLPTILEIAGDPDDPENDFSTLARLLRKARFSGILASDYVDLTVFAPDNDAFAALGDETVAAVEDDLRLLRSVLKNHLAVGSLDSTELAEAGQVRTVLGKTLAITEDDPDNPISETGLLIDGKPIDQANIQASNGIVHRVGEVLVPEAPKSLVDVASEHPDLNTFVDVLTAAELAPIFDSTRKWPSYTIFAPNDEAFAAIPAEVLDALLADPTGDLADILKLHVVRGRIKSSHLYDGQILYSLAGKRLEVSISDADPPEVRINNALVVETDLMAENGVIHVLGAVIATEPFTVADFVASKGYLETLHAALVAANLADTLDNTDPDAGPSDFTLFAPLDSAFDRLPEGTLEALLADPSGDLTQILLYHVLGESLSADELVEAGTATTLQGAEVEITSRTLRFWGWRFPYSIVKVNGHRVVAADFETDNGVVHLISGVLLPPSEEPPAGDDGGEENDE